MCRSAGKKPATKPLAVCLPATTATAAAVEKDENKIMRNVTESLEQHRFLSFCEKENIAWRLYLYMCISNG